PVVREPGAVQLDHALGVVGGPEDVVVEEAVAVVRGLLGDLRRADGAVPDERRYAVQRAGRGGEALQRGTELALPGDDVLAPRPVRQGGVVECDVGGQADVLPGAGA